MHARLVVSLGKSGLQRRLLCSRCLALIGQRVKQCLVARSFLLEIA